MIIEALKPTARPGATPPRGAGFTLVEVVMGISLIGICVGGVATGVLYGLRRAQNAQELETLNRNADRLNREAADVLAFQVEP